MLVKLEGIQWQVAAGYELRQKQSEDESSAFQPQHPQSEET